MKRASKQNSNVRNQHPLGNDANAIVVRFLSQMKFQASWIFNYNWLKKFSVD